MQLQMLGGGTAGARLHIRHLPFFDFDKQAVVKELQCEPDVTGRASVL
jgi:hypothetical protein